MRLLIKTGDMKKILMAILLAAVVQGSTNAQTKNCNCNTMNTAHKTVHHHTARKHYKTVIANTPMADNTTAHNKIIVNDNTLVCTTRKHLTPDALAGALAPAVFTTKTTTCTEEPVAKVKKPTPLYVTHTISVKTVGSYAGYRHTALKTHTYAQHKKNNCNCCNNMATTRRKKDTQIYASYYNLHKKYTKDNLKVAY